MSNIIMGIVAETLVTQAGRTASGDAPVERPEGAMEPTATEAEVEVTFATLMAEVPAPSLAIAPDARAKGETPEILAPEDTDQVRVRRTDTQTHAVSRIPFDPVAFRVVEQTMQTGKVGRIDPEPDDEFVSISPEKSLLEIKVGNDAIGRDAPEIAARPLPEPDLPTKTPTPDRTAKPLQPTPIDVAPVDRTVVETTPQYQPAPVHPSGVDHGATHPAHERGQLRETAVVSAPPAPRHTEPVETPSNTAETSDIRPNVAPYPRIDQPHPQTAHSAEQPPLSDAPVPARDVARDQPAGPVQEHIAMMLAPKLNARPEAHSVQTGSNRDEGDAAQETDGRVTVEGRAIQNTHLSSGTALPNEVKSVSVLPKSTDIVAEHIGGNAPPFGPPTTDMGEGPARLYEDTADPEPDHVTPLSPPAHGADHTSPPPSMPTAQTTLSQIDASAPTVAPLNARSVAQDVPPVTRQIAIAVSKSDGGTIDLALRPVELGETQISMEFEAERLIVTIAAERPETQELMRRHIDDLAREFRDLGYRDVSFRFEQQTGQHGQPRQVPPDSPPSNQGELEPDLFPETPTHQPTYVSARLDIRL